MASSGKLVLVTVGSTKFDALVKAVDSTEFAAALRKKGYTKLVIQHGNGAYTPHVLVPINQKQGTTPDGLEVECFDYNLQLLELMSKASLVISHAGSGSIFEALSGGKSLIVVPNPLLMDNHQVELGEQLAAMQHLVCATPDNLVAAVASFDPSALKPYKKGSPAKIADVLNNHIWGQQ